MNAETIVPTFHVLLVGIDRYPLGCNSLAGCVNDIDAVENLLLEPPGIGIRPESICITRLAAVRADQTSAYLRYLMRMKSESFTRIVGIVRIS